MFNFKSNLFIVTVWTILFSSSLAMAIWDGSDSTSFNWNEISTIEYFWYLDGDDIVRQCSCKAAYITKDFISNHVSTSTGAGVKHTHYENDYGQGDLATIDQVNAFWDAAFRSPDICSFNSGTTNQVNCYAWTCQNSFPTKGTYNYWFNKGDGALQQVLTDAQTVNPISNVNVGNMLNYPSTNHASFVYNVEDGVPTAKLWKFAGSGIYAVQTPIWSRFNTPMCAGGAIVDASLAEQTWSWSNSGAGSESDVEVYKPKP